MEFHREMSGKDELVIITSLFRIMNHKIKKKIKS